MDVCTGAGALAGRFVGNVRPARKFVGRRPLLWFGYACRSGLHWPNNRRLNNADHGATAANVRSDSSEYVLSAYQLKGQGFAEQDGRLAETQPDQFVLYDTTRPYRLSFDGPFAQRVFRLPRKLLDRRAAAFAQMMARPFDGTRGRAFWQVGSAPPF
jgi:hypothetical protein